MTNSAINDRNAPPYRYDEAAAIKCHQIVSKALRRKQIIKPETCECCDSKPDVAHHFNYNKPLEITWCCHRCHRRIHKNIQALLWLGGWPSSYKPPGIVKKPLASKAQEKARTYRASNVQWTPLGWTKEQVADHLSDMKKIQENLKRIRKQKRESRVSA